MTQKGKILSHSFIHSFIQSHGFHRIVNLIWHSIMKNWIPPKPTGLKHRKCCTQGDNIVSAHRWLPGCKLHRCVYTAQVSVVIGCLVTHHHLILQVLWLKIHHNRQLCYESLHDEICWMYKQVHLLFCQCCFVEYYCFKNSTSVYNLCELCMVSLVY